MIDLPRLWAAVLFVGAGVGAVGLVLGVIVTLALLVTSDAPALNVLGLLLTFAALVALVYLLPVPA